MITTIITKGFISGLLITGGLGPIGLLCIRRSLQQGFKAGLATGLGAALADALYAILGFLSINLVYDYLANHTTQFKTISGISFIFIGIKILLSTNGSRTIIGKSKGFISNFSSGLLLTLANPGTLIALMALITSFGLSEIAITTKNTFLLGISVFAGSLIWWILLSVSSNYMKNKINEKTLKMFNNACGIGLIIFGAIAIISTL